MDGVVRPSGLVNPMRYRKAGIPQGGHGNPAPLPIPRPMPLFHFAVPELSPIQYTRSRK